MPAWTDQEQSRKARNLRTRESRVPDTRKIWFQNVTSFGHKTTTWLLSNQAGYDIMECGGASLGRGQRSRGAGTPESRRVLLDLDTCQAQRENHDNDQTTLEILEILEGYGDLAEP